jgi:beta-carotene 3-hydroxylase
MMAAIAFVVAFVAMEGVSYAAHRWLMHGPGMAWHASHHAPPKGGFERNDLFPVCFSIVGFGLFALAALGAVPGWVWWSAAGVTAYGMAYMMVHELFIHRRLAVTLPDVGYLRWLRRSHAAHHVDGGEPYGMLLPLMSRADRQRVESSPPGRDSLSRRTTRDTRARL